MTLHGRPIPRTPLAALLALAALAGCKSTPEPPYDPYYDPYEPEPAPQCDPGVVVTGNSPALMVTDPAALAKLPLEDVLGQLLERAGDAQTTRLELIQRLFDTNHQDGAAVFDDGVHCDSPSNLAHFNGPAAKCPRTEGALAASNGFFKAGDPDHFSPIAVVNRLDLMPTFGFSCGEYRIIYAKDSGKTDPDDRVFLIFEMALPNPDPGNLYACRPVADFWKSLEDEPDAETMAVRLRSFFMNGISPFGALVTPENLGLNSGGGASYYGSGGQVRVSQFGAGEDDWEYRQMVTMLSSDGRLRFEPTPVGNNPLPSRFEGDTSWFADSFVEMNVATLAGKSIFGMSMTVDFNDLAGESALGGAANNDYAARAANNLYLKDMITDRIQSMGLGNDCPDDDPLTADSILQRATMDSCAGCHAPAQFLGAERKIGCGLTWPESLGEAHVDENGNRSPALKDVFLPRRAEVFTTYLQSCSDSAVEEAFGGSTGAPTTKSASTRQTIGGSTTH